MTTTPTTDRTQATVAVLAPDAPARFVTLDLTGEGNLDLFRAQSDELAAIGTFTLVPARHDIDLWADDEALLTTDPRVNLVASTLAGTPLFGAIVATGGDDETGDTTGLTPAQINTIVHANQTVYPEHTVYPDLLNDLL